MNLHTFPTGSLIDTVTLSDGSPVDVTVMDMVDICGFFQADHFGLGCAAWSFAPRTGAFPSHQGCLNDLPSCG